jgi:hypothetical protein
LFVTFDVTASITIQDKPFRGRQDIINANTQTDLLDNLFSMKESVSVQPKSFQAYLVSELFIESISDSIVIALSKIIRYNLHGVFNFGQDKHDAS